MTTAEIKITDTKVFVNGVELIRLQRRFWKAGKRDVISYKRKFWDILTKKVVWRKWYEIDTIGQDHNHPKAAYTGWYEKSQEEIEKEILEVVDSMMSIITHPTRGDFSELYPELENVEWKLS